ncbi:alpha-galactosidase [Salinibacterium sp. NSLL150]|uniref:alpha-galactosidase n=1 Tax=unclassified Salinibacterium TaxID=2632331 RepID=UPI0018CE55AD|nr:MULTISPECIES: alpha-galactosidase [unclassified Salinibacterium]MBH0098120.1 alpha-galactosidase [Salinibacterium sp. NSLL35]MBH0100875.1 alpha-galactosidase [Salinibacterium sp. NSLL150]MBH0103634.1 alpha-galactosidase [Salinibacterium sp. NSLL16]MBH0106395.1 alpha-galactosidase [Salinibacterium sp. NSLL17]
MLSTNNTNDLVHLRAAGTSFVLDARGTGVPSITHWGADLGELDRDELAALADSRERAIGPSSIDEPFRLSIVPLLAEGWTGLPGLEGRHDRAAGASGGRVRRPSLQTASIEHPTPDRISVTLVDDDALSLTIDFELSAAGVLRSRSRLTNTATEAFELSSLATVLPLPPVARERLDFSGIWAAERQPQRSAIDYGTWLRESRHGRRGHNDSFLTVSGTPGFGFRHGEVWAVHAGTSGDTRVWIDRLALGYTTVGIAELLSPGEVRLATGDTHETPWAYAAWSNAGLDGLSDRFHDWFRSLPAHPSTPRPLTLNTWEAVYFDHNFDQLAALADAAADVGVERFVLDDGWMTGRTDDKRALGDWTVDATSWPEGLAPLVDRVTASGMQFGLWVEPEMVSLDSELAREHPEWILRDDDRPLPKSWRNQHVLDLDNPAAREHVRDAIAALLDEYAISYLKWDMNRDLLGGSVHRHVAATYLLMDELRERYPHVEIESCASGGARVDAGVLERVQRVWPSDTNDAHDRFSIMRWTNLLVPFEYLGSHVGSSPAHTSGRSLSLGFRLATALMGHSGIEWDLTTTTAEEQEALRTWASAYRSLRGLIHSGRVVRSELSADPIITGVVAEDINGVVADALYWVTSLTTPTDSVPTARRLPGLDPHRMYRITPVDVGAEAATYPGTAPAWWHDGELTLSGAALGSVGLTLPILHPDEALVLRVTAVGGEDSSGAL